MVYGIIFGSKSFEHEISIVSAIAMKKVLDRQPVYIFADSQKQLYNIPADKITSKLFSSGSYKKFDTLTIKHGGFFSKTMFGETKLEFDVVLNLIHGKDGEDGTVASLLEFFDIAYIGPRLEASAISYNKTLTKLYAKHKAVAVLEFESFKKDDDIVVDNYPVIIKPSCLGSSIGVSIVKNRNELQYAVDVAFEFDDEIIVEPFIKDIKELNIAGACIDGEFVFSIIEEPQKGEFLDFEKKYLDFSRTSQVSRADISDNLAKKVRDTFAKVYNNTFTGSIIRCDFFIYKEEIVLNEINSIPGSYANYLFDDFNQVIDGVARSLPQIIDIKIDYAYVNKIQQAKGK